ncbi:MULTISPECIES: hypothetical protein [Acidobacteriaceae]|uniref:hypothetical protein n=1 Tax=Acidobacteriaceae TaxID=204434 RepID=UPI00131CF887|nr:MULTISPECIES: hypothetical protein [Acidobacteriaceae]MDW5264474.1 hypothetical protein [Edaphobacter sp.]
MATIRVPGPPPEAFRKNRPISDLIKSQIKHFQHLEHKLQLTLPTKFLPHDLTTEAAASQYIAEMTSALRNRTPSAQPVPTTIRVVPSPKPDTTPAARTATPVPLKSTRQSNGIAIAASASKKSRAKKHAPAKHAKKKS